MLDFLVYFAMAVLYAIITSEMFCMAIIEVKNTMPLLKQLKGGA